MIAYETAYVTKTDIEFHVDHSWACFFVNDGRLFIERAQNNMIWSPKLAHDGAGYLETV